MFNLHKALDIAVVDECNGLSVAVGASRTTYTMHIVLGIVGHVEVDDDTDIVDVDAASHDVGSHEHVYHTRLEAVHHIVTLGLREVAVHRCTVDLQA